MNRRDFMTLVGGAAAMRLRAARAQPTKAYRIGYLSSSSTTDDDGRLRVAALKQALEHRGWVEGDNVRIDYYSAGGDTERARASAKDVVSLAPDVILAGGSPMLAAVQQETRTIPIVFVAVIDPIGQGFVTSFAHPGGNVTGFSNFDPAMGGKWLELLKQIAPAVARIAFLFNPKTSPASTSVLRAVEAAANSFAVGVTAAPVLSAADISDAMIPIAGERNGGLIVASDAFTLLHRDLIAAQAAEHRLPAIYPLHDFTRSGGLIVYGVDLVEQFRQAAGYIDRILRGAKPGDLPVQAPTKFEFIINLKTAKQLGITIPPSILARADEVIE